MTSPLDGTQVKVAGSGAILKAPLGTTLPTDSTTAWGSSWVNLGFATDGFSVKQDKKVQEIFGWQSLDTLRVITQQLARTFLFELLQTNKDVLALAFDGAVITPTTGGVYTMALPDPSLSYEFMLGCDWSDGVDHMRFVAKRACLMSLPQIHYGRQDSVKYALEVRALAPSDGSAAIATFGVDTAVGGP